MCFWLDYLTSRHAEIHRLVKDGVGNSAQKKCLSTQLLINIMSEEAEEKQAKGCFSCSTKNAKCSRRFCSVHRPSKLLGFPLFCRTWQKSQMKPQQSSRLICEKKTWIRSFFQICFSSHLLSSHFVLINPVLFYKLDVFFLYPYLHLFVFL